MKRPLACLATLLLACVWSWSTAHAQTSLAGTYRPSALRIEAQVSTWGDDCGVRPKSQELPEPGTVEVKREGAHYSLRFSDRTLRTNGCWSPNPAVKLLNATTSGDQFRADCRTATGDAKRETGRYSFSGGMGKIELVEESDYDWQLKTSHCVAKVRTTQTLIDVKTPIGKEPAAQKAPCVAGALARIRVRPSESSLLPGERVCFTVKGFDARGCALDVANGAVSFSLSKPPGADATLGGGCFKAAKNAADAEGTFSITASALGFRSDATVVVAASDLSDITARRGQNADKLSGVAEGGDETVLESGIRAVARGSHGAWWLGLCIAGMAAVLSVVAIAALRVARHKARARESDEDAPLGASSFPSAPPSIAAPRMVIRSGTHGPQRVCPRCRIGYPPGTESCSADGSPLLDYDEFARRASASDAAEKTCPHCGKMLDVGAAFCGFCGQHL